MSEKKKAPVGRRDFFKKAGLGVGAAGMAAAALSAKESKAEETASRPGGAGYRETAHVKKYYQLARF